MEHYFPGLADHAQAPGRFLGGELGAAAIDSGDAAALEFAQAVMDGVEIIVHETEKDPPDHEAETGKGHHGRGLEVAFRALRLELAPLLERAAVEQFAEAAATRRRLQDGLERSQPCGELRLLRPEHRLQHLGDVIEVHVRVFQARGRAERKILDEQEIRLVAVTGRLRGLLHVMDEKMAQHGFVRQRRGLQKLAQLVHLDLRVDLLEPGLGVLDRLGRRREFLGIIFIDRAGGDLNHKFAHQRSVHGLQGAERRSLIFECRLEGRIGGYSHDFKIQLGTGLRKRTATTVRSGWY